MTKFTIKILEVFCNEGAETEAKSMTIQQVLDCMDEKHRKAYPTAYRHITLLLNNGYLKRSLDDGAASTYYITATGKSFFEAHN